MTLPWCNNKHWQRQRYGINKIISQVRHCNRKPKATVGQASVGKVLIAELEAEAHPPRIGCCVELKHTPRRNDPENSHRLRRIARCSDNIKWKKIHTRGDCTSTSMLLRELCLPVRLSKGVHCTVTICFVNNRIYGTIHGLGI